MTADPQFPLRDGILHAEDIPLPELADRYGTPLYVYSRAALQTAWQRYAQAIAGRDALVERIGALARFVGSHRDERLDARLNRFDAL